MNKRLEETLNDPLLDCEVLETKEDDSLRVSLIKWVDGTFSIAKADKKMKKISVSETKDESRALERFAHNLA